MGAWLHGLAGHVDPIEVATPNFIRGIPSEPLGVMKPEALEAVHTPWN